MNWKTITNELHKRWVFITSDTKQTIMAIIGLLLVIGVIIMLRHMHIRNQYSDEAQLSWTNSSFSKRLVRKPRIWYTVINCGNAR